MPKDPRLPVSDWRSYQGAITTLAVGEQEVEYKVHEVLLSKRSEFFASASKEEWKEGQEHRVPLPDDTPSVVDLYIQWIYTGGIVSPEKPTEEEEDDRECKNEQHFDLLIGGFVFGEKVQDGDFKDAVVDALIHTVATPNQRGVCWYPTKHWVDQAYVGTPKGSPLRRLLVDMHTFHGKKDWLDGQKNVDFLADLAGHLLVDRRNQYQQHLPDPTRPDANGCWYYHHHGEADGCYAAGASGRVS